MYMEDMYKKELKLFDFPLYVMFHKDELKISEKLCMEESIYYVCDIEVNDYHLYCFTMMKHGADYNHIKMGNYTKVSERFKGELLNSMVIEDSFYALAFNPEFYYDKVARHYNLEDVNLIKGCDLVQMPIKKEETFKVDYSLFNKLQKFMKTV